MAGPGIRSGAKRRAPKANAAAGTALQPTWADARVQAARGIAEALNLPASQVSWEKGIPQLAGGDGMVVRTPWARVVVGRTPTSATRFGVRWLAGSCDWLVDGLQAAYPHGLSEWLPSPRLLEQTGAMTKETRAFLTWSLPRIGTHGFRAAPDVWVLGAWATWRDAVLVARHEEAQTDGWAYQLRGQAALTTVELDEARAHLLAQAQERLEKKAGPGPGAQAEAEG